jgi:hypothetical protein
MSERWYLNHRIEWMREVLAIYGFINRVHIIRKFGLSVPQASADLQELQRRHPDEIAYDKSAKRYLYLMNGSGTEGRTCDRATLKTGSHVPVPFSFETD